MKIQTDKYTIFSLELGDLLLDGGAVFGLIPKPLWQKKIACDAENRIRLAMRALLVVGGGRVILIDTGAGICLPEKICRLYDIDPGQNYLEQNLRAVGFTPADVTDVVLTHLHFDHCGGAVVIMDGERRPTFSAARYYVQESHFNWAMHPSVLDRASYVREHFLTLEQAGLLQRLTGAQMLFPGIEIIVSDGHVCGQQLVLIHDARRPVFFACDLAPTAHHVTPTWITAFDLQPLMLVEEKQRLFERAHNENWLIVFPHDPQIIAGQIAAGDKRIELKPEFFR